MSSAPASLDFLLEPADGERLAELCGQFDEHLRQVERRLGVEVNNRGNRFRVIGEPDAVRAAGEVLRALYASTAEQPLDPQRVNLFLQEAGVEALVDATANDDGADDPAIETKRGIVRGRGPNQQRYLRNIATHDLNFGIGPAGTGKTFLAVACAVDALENDRVRRIVLVRPAVEAGERLGFLPGDMAQKVDPYLRPLYDALYEMLGFEKVARLIERHVIEVAPLAFMRGRAQPLFTRVLTEDGFRAIGSLKVGERVIGSDGKPTRVVGVFPQGRKEVFRVTAQDGASTLCCGEHLWAVRTPEDKRDGKPARILETAQMAGKLRRAHQRRYELPMMSEPAAFRAAPVPMDPYALGLLLGDGCITCSTTPSFSTADPELAQALAVAFENIELVTKSRYDYVLRHTAGGRGGLRIPNPVTVTLRDLGLAGTRSNSKFVPEAYLYNSAAVRLSVLQGLLDTDGGPVTQAARTCRIHFSTTSSQLMKDVVFLVRSLGGTAMTRVRRAEGRRPGRANGRPVPYRSDAFVVDIRLPEVIEPFRLERKRALYHRTGGGRPMRFIESIEPEGIQDCVCIQVEAEDHLYVTEDFLVTHNTLNDSFIILDEAQNTTVEQMKMFLTRIGFGSTAVVTGDVTQTDLPRHLKSGLRDVTEVLKDVEGISFTFFTQRDVVRHPLVQRVIGAYERHEQSGD